MCIPCNAGWHGECEEKRVLDSLDENLYMCCCFESTVDITALSPGIVTPIDTRKFKANEDIKDQTSTGRKRAAALYPIPTVQEGGMTCEWAWLVQAGGGVFPVVGCQGNIIADTKEKIYEEDGTTVSIYPGHAHHGPDKSTLNNDLGNVHRVCPVCHNRWHSLNDDFYPTRPESGLPFIPLSGMMVTHDSVSHATTADFAYSDNYWSLSTKARKQIPFAPPSISKES